jgi:hypothetical protein
VVGVLAGGQVVRHVQCEAAGIGNTGHVETVRHRLGVHPPGIGGVEVDPGVGCTGAEPVDGTRKHAGAIVDLSLAHAVEVAQRVRFEDHHCGAVADGGDEGPDPRVVGGHAAGTAAGVTAAGIPAREVVGDQEGELVDRVGG